MLLAGENSSTRTHIIILGHRIISLMINSKSLDLELLQNAFAVQRNHRCDTSRGRDHGAVYPRILPTS